MFRESNPEIGLSDTYVDQLLCEYQLAFWQAIHSKDEIKAWHEAERKVQTIYDLDDYQAQRLATDAATKIEQDLTDLDSLMTGDYTL